jgi:outer membrane protein W
MKNTSIYICGLAFFMLFGASSAFAGNPDRQGEAGAYELLINPWARAAGLNGLVTARVTGIEAMNFNPAGVGRISGKTEVGLAHTQYLVGTGLSLNTAALAQKIGSGGAIGVSIMSMNFGEIPQTTVNQPEGFATFKPSFFNIGISYSYVFKDEKTKQEKVAVGFGMRVVSESIANASATGVAFDAGVQYVTGADRQVKFGIALRNIGTKMKFKGDGLTFTGIAPNGTTALSVDGRPAGFELPSLLHIGLSYDFLFAEKSNRITLVGNFTANSFSRDQIGLGLEYGFREMFMARVGFKYENLMFDPVLSTTASTGLAAGITAEVPFKKGSAQRIGFDYAFELTRVFGGTHSIGIKLNI